MGSNKHSNRVQERSVSIKLCQLSASLNKRCWQGCFSAIKERDPDANEHSREARRYPAVSEDAKSRRHCRVEVTHSRKKIFRFDNRYFDCRNVVLDRDPASFFGHLRRCGTAELTFRLELLYTCCCWPCCTCLVPCYQKLYLWRMAPRNRAFYIHRLLIWRQNKQLKS